MLDNPRQALNVLLKSIDAPIVVGNVRFCKLLQLPNVVFNYVNEDMLVGNVTDANELQA